MEYFSTYLNILISLVFILALCSILLSIFYELIAYYFKYRAKFLKTVIADVLTKTLPNGKMNLTELLYNHPQIDLTKKTYRHLPSYISSKNFAQTLTETINNKYIRDHTVITNNPLEKASILGVDELSRLDKITLFSRAVESLGYSDLQLFLKGFINNSNGQIDKLHQDIAEWYDEYMNRATGWYKVQVQKRLVFIGFIICICFNMDFFAISKSLIQDKGLAESIAKVAEEYPIVEKIDSIKTDEEYWKYIQKKDSIIQTLYTIKAPIFWYSLSTKEITEAITLKKILGWAIMTCLMSLGGPFWFDALNKLVNLRKTGIKPSNVSKDNR